MIVRASYLKYFFYICFTLHLLLSIVVSKSGMTMADRKEVLDAHNTFRNMKNLDPTAMNILRLFYDSDLEYMAKNWADKCQFGKSIGSFDTTKFYDDEIIGQNTYAKSGKRPNVTDIVSSWYMEKENYSFGEKTCAPNKFCENFTQVVWATTQFVECWMSYCPKLGAMVNVNNFVCNYFPGGNDVNIHPYMVGPLCLACMPPTNKCDNYICDVYNQTNSCMLVAECAVDLEYKKHCLCPEEFYLRDRSTGSRSSTGTGAIKLISVSIIVAIFI